jgi:hypothetical protein
VSEQETKIDDVYKSIRKESKKNKNLDEEEEGMKEWYYKNNNPKCI